MCEVQSNLNYGSRWLKIGTAPQIPEV